MRVLVTGATGYVGGRLTPRLLREGHAIRVIVRDPARIASRPWADQVEVVPGDLLKAETLRHAFDGIDVAYYLVHSMCAGSDYSARDRLAAENFSRAAAGVRHVIYLSGLQPQTKNISRHLQSRAEIGRILARHTPTTEFQAGPIIGSGSASFEMLRYLTERTPLMIAPGWVRNEIQPIAIRDALAYLIRAIERGPSGIVEIGGDRLTYQQMMHTYARLRGLRRGIVILPPVLPAWIGARLIGCVIPLPFALTVPLVEGMAHPLIANDRRARQRFPEVHPISYEKAVKLALCRIQEQAVETRWSGAATSTTTGATYEYRDLRGVVREVRSLHVEAPPDVVFRVFRDLGGHQGWLAWNWVQRLREFCGRLAGSGPPKASHREQPLLPGDVLDSWRVEAVHAPYFLRLRAEARLPGSAWLQWEAMAERSGTRLTQTASFAPRGLSGSLYWSLLYPLHRLILIGMAKAIRRKAVRARLACQDLPAA